MLGLFKKKNPYKDAAQDVYARVSDYVRNPVFYARYNVPDTFDGRFDLLLLHLFAVIEGARGKTVGAEDFHQALFDEMFADMDQVLREMGIGDMGIPKHQRKMMRAFNGRMHAYTDAKAAGTMEEALRRNLYGTVESPSSESVSAFAAYCDTLFAAFEAADFDAILSGAVFDDLEEKKL